MSDRTFFVTIRMMLRWEKIKEWLEENQEYAVITIAVFLVAIISFNAGRIYSEASLNRGVELISSRGSNANDNAQQNTTSPADKLDLRVVGSKNSDKFHYLWCPGAKSIKEENKIYFGSDQEAKSRGYTLAGNCSK